MFTQCLLNACNLFADCPQCGCEASAGGIDSVCRVFTECMQSVHRGFAECL